VSFGKLFMYVDIEVHLESIDQCMSCLNAPREGTANYDHLISWGDELF